jgi:hypothetical protein
MAQLEPVVVRVQVAPPVREAQLETEALLALLALLALSGLPEPMGLQVQRAMSDLRALLALLDRLDPSDPQARKAPLVRTASAMAR